MNKPIYECDVCFKTFTRKETLNSHMVTHQPLAIEEREHSNTDNSVHTLTSQSNNTTTTTTTTSDSYNTTNNNHNNMVFNINYTAKIDDDTIHNTINTRLLAKYLKKGEEGFADFLLSEIFSNRDIHNRRAIACINKKECDFVYRAFDRSGNVKLYNDPGFDAFKSYLNLFDDSIRSQIYGYSPIDLGCQGSTMTTTNKKVQDLTSSILSRKKLPSYLAKKVRASSTTSSQSFLDPQTHNKEEIKQKGIEIREELERNNQTSYNTHTRTMDEEIKHKQFLHMKSQYNPDKERFNQMMKGIKNPQFEWCDIENKPIVIGSYIKQNEEENRQFEEKVRREKQEREEKERLRQERKEKTRQHKEEMKRGDVLVKTQAIREEIEKKKQKTINRINKQTNKQTNKQSIASPIERLDTIQE